ncbi:MAG: sulfatase [Candidatus Eisenbacteria bacterium]
MVRHAFLSFACTALVLLAGCGGDGPDPRPNVLLVLIDSLREDHLGFAGYGRNTSPVLDRLAGEGIVFERTYAPSSWTKPSVATLLTGLYPESHGVLREIGPGAVLAGDLVTVAEALRGAGYATYGFVANPLVNPEFGFDQGFDEFRVFDGWIDQSSGPLTDEVKGWTARAEKGRPFFTFVHYLDPHGAYQPPINYEEFFRGIPFPEKRAVLGGLEMVLSGEPRRETGERPVPLPVPVPLSESDRDFLVALYDSEIRFLDGKIGELLETMERRGLLENTLVIVTADHGEEFLDHGLLRHGFQLYEETVRIPLVIGGPGLPGEFRGARRGEGAGLVDVAPTILAACGLGAPPGGGRNLLRAPEEGERLLAGSTFYRGLERRYAAQGDRKLILDDARGTAELYDLAADPGEGRNHAGEDEASTAALERALEAHLRDLPAPPPAEATTGRVTDDLRRKMRALGYVVD